MKYLSEFLNSKLPIVENILEEVLRVSNSTTLNQNGVVSHFQCHFICYSWLLGGSTTSPP
eukprot:m.54500 g.54500  ORF g.54500 m.54500 type:complete len:60 (-) comp10931_c1_seq3:1102-1281(-)